MYLGPAATPLGMLATILERYDDGAAHFERALVEIEAAGARPFRAHAAAAYATLLRRRGADGDVARAETLEHEALAIATELGMTGLKKSLGDPQEKS